MTAAQLDVLVAAAMQRLRRFVNRSAGQHLRAMRKSQDAAAADHQMALDVLYRVGCQYNVKDADMRALYDLALINFNELQNYSGVTA